MRPNFRNTVFLVNIIQRDFTYKIERDFNFLLNFFLVRLIFDGISLINFDGISLINFGLIHFLISFFVSRYLTVSLRGPVPKPYDEGASPNCDGWTDGTGWTVLKSVL